MNAFRYDTSGSWYKGNTHIHSPASDGGTPVAEIARLYAAAGYDFLFATDHRVSSNFAANPDPDAPLVWLDGIELDGKDDTGAAYHVVCLGRVEGITAQSTLAESLALARAQGGLLILAHPFWCGNSCADATRHGFPAVEVYNHVCHWLNGKSDGAIHWHAMLADNPNTLAFAADDAHLRPEHPLYNGGWIVVNAPECTAEALIPAIRRGNFYASCGPRFESIELVGTTVRIRTSPVRFVRLVGPSWFGNRIGDPDPAKVVTEASFEIPEDWPYVCLEIEDAATRRAWTNPLFVR